MRVRIWLVAVSVVAASDLAVASPPLCNAVIDWQAPAPCPARDEFASLLAAEVAVAPRRTVYIEVRIEKTPDRFVLSWRIGSTGKSSDRDAGVTGARELADKSCDVVARAAATVIALAIEPGAEAGAENPLARGQTGQCVQISDDESPRLFRRRDEAATSGVTSGATSGATSGPAGSNTSFAPQRRGIDLFGLPLDFALQIMAGLDAGTLPEATASLRAAASAQRGRWRLELGGSHLMARRSSVASGPGRLGSDIAVTAATLRLCLDLYRGPVSGALCTGGQFGRFASNGFQEGLEGTEVLASRAAYAAFGGGGSLALAIRKYLYFRLDVDLWLPLARPAFGICDSPPPPPGGGGDSGCAGELRTLWQPEPIAARLACGLELVFR